MHTNAEGADLNARVVIAGLKALRDNALIKTVSAEGRAEIAAPETILMPHLHRPASAAREDFVADAKDLGLRNSLLAARSGPQRVLFTINTKTGETKEILREHEWLNHEQFSPTDPTLIMFCHEGTWHEVDLRTDGTGLTKIHIRTMNMEIAGHEFFSADGHTIWNDLQTPRGLDFWLAGDQIATGKRTWYHLQQNEWSVHYNVSPDGTLFAGDGGDSEMVARAPDGKWFYLFRPERVRTQPESRPQTRQS